MLSPDPARALDRRKEEEEEEEEEKRKKIKKEISLVAPTCLTYPSRWSSKLDNGGGAGPLIRLGLRHRHYLCRCHRRRRRDRTFAGADKWGVLYIGR